MDGKVIESIQSSDLLDLDSATPEAAVAHIVRHAAELGASDLFFCTGGESVTVQMRHLGIVRPLSVLQLEQGRRCLGHIKAAAGMSTSEHRRPQDGRWIFDLQASHRAGSFRNQKRNIEAGSGLDLRINSIPTLYGEDMALRLLQHDHQHLVLEQLGMTSSQLEQYRSMLQHPGGLILITGPTGSGKTATLYSSLIRLNDGTRKINTIEDPIEHAVEGLRQSQVNPAIDLGFSPLLRSVLRQNPDVIMVGEIRDEETAQTAVHAANSGTLVFATLHAPAAPAAIQSLRNLGAHPHFLASSLRGVVAQRLVRTLCPECRGSFDLGDAPYTFEEIRNLLGPDEGRKLFSAPGCVTCGMTGYSDRTGVFEVMPITGAIRDLIAYARPARELREKAIEEGMVQFRQAALLKVARGETSIEEVFRVIPTEHLLLED
ncbi:MAG TPA: GspE/PulE family protein [Tepidisphaeraceae bacterium]|nr:GspE/PulE family protein [Tepidisphaeraceae bacterium]